MSRAPACSAAWTGGCGTGPPAQRRAEPPPRARTLVDVFQETVRAHPDRLAIEAADGAFSYLELDGLAYKLSAALNEAGIGAGDRVGGRIPSASMSEWKRASSAAASSR